MKFAIITDIHLGPKGYHKGILRKINHNIKTLLRNFIEEINNNIKPEFVVVLGDLIEDENEINDKKNIKYVVKLLKKLKYPVYYVTGNHDSQNISENELTRIFNNQLYYSFDVGNYHIIVLFTKSKFNKNTRVSKEQISWLKEDLDKTNKKTIVFSHHSLAAQNLKGNPWFEDSPEYHVVINRRKIRKILEKSNRVIGVFNGHLHWNKKNIHGKIPYFTIQSLVENEDDKGIASETHAIINIVGSKIDVKIKGNYPKEY